MNARHGSGQLAPDFAAKGIEIPLPRPLHERPWLRTLAFCLACASGLFAAVALGFFNRWHDDNLAELARQRRSLEAFLHSEEFAEFARASDRQFVALLNFISVRPRSARDALPAVAACEAAHHLLPWTLEVLPLPVSAASQPERVLRAGRGAGALLTRRGVVLDEAARKRAWLMFARLLAPYAQRFHQRMPDAAFPALVLDRSMQEAALRALAAYHGASATTLDVERVLNLYATIGPAMWQAIERERTFAMK